MHTAWYQTTGDGIRGHRVRSSKALRLEQVSGNPLPMEAMRALPLPEALSITCGQGGQRELLLGVDDGFIKENRYRSIPRADVAELAVQAVGLDSARNRCVRGSLWHTEMQVRRWVDRRPHLVIRTQPLHSPRAWTELEPMEAEQMS